MKKINRAFILISVIILTLSMLVTACSSKDSSLADNGSMDTTTSLSTDGSSGSSDDYSAKDSTVADSLASSSDLEGKVSVGEAPKTSMSSDASAIAEAAGEIAIAPSVDINEIPSQAQPTTPHAGLLTAGEWNDNKNRDFMDNLIANGQEMNYKSYFTAWNLVPLNCITATVSSSAGDVLEYANVFLYDTNGNIIWSAVTDNTGTAYLYYNLDTTTDSPAMISVNYYDTQNVYMVTEEDLNNPVVNITLNADSINLNKLDLMFVIDTTGSMSDEISYLQEELKDVINRVKNDNANIPIRLSVNFYRDIQDAYVLNPYPFSDNIAEQLSFLAMESADGGGDYEEAVEQALNDAIYNHSWDADSTKLLFLVLDAPPHNTQSIRTELAETIKAAAALGVRIIPVASSGVDKSTEFLLRTFAMTTGGTYSFLTNDSGIGGEHIEPTIGSYTVEFLNDLLVRVIDSYLS